MSCSVSACACVTSVCASSKAPLRFLHTKPSRLRSPPCEIDLVLVASSASPAVTGASPSSPSHWVHCHSGKREPDWARHPVAFLSWRRWRRLTTSDLEPMLRRKDKSQSKQRHAKRMVGNWQWTDALSLSICQPVNLLNCQTVNLSTCQPVNLSTCQPVNLSLPLSNELSHVCR